MTPGRARLIGVLGLLGVVAVAGLVRATGIAYGDPYVYHPDEWAIVHPAMAMARDGDWNPHTFFYPSLLIELDAVVMAIVRFAGGGPLDTGWPGLFAVEALPSQFAYHLAARLLVLAIGLAAIAIIGAVAWIRAGPVAGIAAAALLAAMPVHIESSRYAMTDVPTTAFVGLTILLTLVAMRGGRSRWYLAAGIAAGLAASTKYNAALVVLVPLIGVLVGRAATATDGGRTRQRTVVLTGFAAVGAFVVTTPAVIGDFSAVQRDLQSVARDYGSGPTGATSLDTLAEYLRALTGHALTTPIFLICLAGMIGLVLGRKRQDLPFVIFPALYLLMISLPLRSYDRNLMPMLPFLALGGGVAIAAVAHRIEGLVSRARGRPHLDPALAGMIAVLLIGLAVAPPLYAGYEAGRVLKRTDTRTIALAWIETHIRPGTPLAREWYTPQTAEPNYPTETWNWLARRSLDWYRQSGARYLIASDTAYQRFFRGDPASAGERRFYEVLFGLREVYRVDSRPDRPGPTIRIFELPRS